MANFMKAAVASAFVFAASAFAQAPPNCPTTAPGGASIVRSEGLTELIGEVSVACPAGPGGTATFTVQLPVAITSKVLSTSGSNQTTEAVAVITADAGTNAGKVYQGVVNTGNPNAATFTLPINAGGTTFTIANIRINANALGTGSFSPVSATVSSISTVVQSSNAVTVAYTNKGLGTPTINGNPSASSTAGVNSYVICSTTSVSGNSTPAFWIHVSEGFPQAFKTLGVSNVALGNEFITNSENGVTPAGSTAGTGVANSGTRIAVTYANLPSNVTLWLPMSVKDDAALATGAGNTGVLTLVTSASTADAPALPLPTASTSSSQPVPALLNGTTVTNYGGVVGAGFVSYAPSNGSVVAYYEVSSASASVLESYSIPAYISFSKNAIAATNSSASVTVGLAQTGAAPNFAATTNAALNGSKFNTCTTSLLFPFVTNQAGFDTGFSIANTSVDPFGTSNQSGTCTLSFYQGTTGNPTSFTTAPVTAGQVFTGLISVLAPSFQGYMIAQCGFQYAHGFAFITDGFGGPGRGLSQGYLAGVIPDVNQTGSARLANDPSKAQSGAGESLAH